MATKNIGSSSSTYNTRVNGDILTTNTNMRTLAGDIDTVISQKAEANHNHDSDYLPKTTIATYATTSNTTYKDVQFRKVGRFCFVTCFGHVGTDFTSTSSAVVPTGYRPVGSNVSLPVTFLDSGDHPYPGYAVITTGGAFYCKTYNAFQGGTIANPSSGYRLYCSGVYRCV